MTKGLKNLSHHISMCAKSCWQILRIVITISITNHRQWFRSINLSFYGANHLEVPKLITQSNAHLPCIILPFFLSIITSLSFCSNISSLPVSCLLSWCLSTISGTHGHVVIAQYIDDINNVFTQIHDPHPDATFLDETEPPVWCMYFKTVHTNTRSWFCVPVPLL